jgi:hypothetical protein
MSDTSLDNSTDTADESSVIKELRKKAEQAGKWESENTKLTREIALLRAGLGSLNPERQEALTAVHKGDWTDEALKATAAALGFLSEPTPPQPAQSEQAPSGPDPSVTAAMGRTDEVTNTGDKPTKVDLDTAILNATSQDEVVALLKAGGIYVDGEL